jgi:hypothetical protein
MIDGNIAALDGNHWKSKRLCHQCKVRNIPCNTLKGDTVFGRLAMKVAKRRVFTRNPPGSRKGVGGVPCALCVVRGQVEKHTGKGTKVSHFCKSLGIGRPG